MVAREDHLSLALSDSSVCDDTIDVRDNTSGFDKD
jgi:hypothetical protein